MTRHEYFRLYIRLGLYKKVAWVFPLFSIVMGDEQMDNRKHKNVPDHLQVLEDISYKPVCTQMGYGYISPDDQKTIIPIKDTEPGRPMFVAKDKITLEAGDLPNVTETVETTVGRAFLNAVLFANSTGTKIPYINKKFTPSDAENQVINLWEDIDENGNTPTKGAITTEEYLKFVDAAFYLRGFSQLFVPGATYKTMTAPPNNAELKAKLIEENKDKLHDPAVVAMILKQLQENDAEYLKGDPGEGFLITKKSREIVRSKKFLMYGAEPGIEEKVEVDTVVNSLEEGWDISKFPSMNNALRAGSFNRGAQTQLGGESVKWLLRASSNIAITVDDCGATIGVPTVIKKGRIKKYTGFTVLLDGQKIVITSETEDQVIGKKVMVRSPLFCKLDKTDYCVCCMGPRLSLNRNAASSAVAGLGSDMMLLYMKAAHAKGLTLAEVDLDEALF